MTAASAPPPNPAWRYSPPAVSRDGKTVAVDAMQLPTILEHYRVAGVKLVSAEELQARRQRR